MRRPGMRLLMVAFLLVAMLVSVNSQELFNGIYSQDSFVETKINIQEEVINIFLVDETITAFAVDSKQTEISVDNMISFNYDEKACSYYNGIGIYNESSPIAANEFGGKFLHIAEFT